MVRATLIDGSERHDGGGNARGAAWRAYPRGCAGGAGRDPCLLRAGESYLDLLDGLYAQRNRIQLTTCRFEAGAVHMAEAYGKLTGRPGVAIVTRGPGACHAAIGVHVAFQDSTPLVLLIGQIPFEETDRDPSKRLTTGRCSRRWRNGSPRSMTPRASRS
ncbi:thiamine pyrophosphate-binding protein [Siccirubricoccus deserti]